MLSGFWMAGSCVAGKCRFAGLNGVRLSWAHSANEEEILSREPHETGTILPGCNSAANHSASEEQRSKYPGYRQPHRLQPRLDPFNKPAIPNSALRRAVHLANRIRIQIRFRIAPSTLHCETDAGGIRVKYAPSGISTGHWRKNYNRRNFGPVDARWLEIVTN